MSNLRKLADIQRQADVETLHEIRRGFSAGMNQVQIAAAMETSPSTICRVIQRFGMKTEKKLVIGSKRSG